MGLLFFFAAFPPIPGPFCTPAIGTNWQFFGACVQSSSLGAFCFLFFKFGWISKGEAAVSLLTDFPNCVCVCTVSRALPRLVSTTFWMRFGGCFVYCRSWPPPRLSICLLINFALWKRWDLKPPSPLPNFGNEFALFCALPRLYLFCVRFFSFFVKPMYDVKTF